LKASPLLGSWEHDLATERLALSADSYTLLGLDAEPFDGSWRSFLARVHPGDRGAVAAAVRHAVSTGLPYELEFRIRTKHGVVRHINERGHIVKDEYGRAARRIAIAKEVTSDLPACKKPQKRCAHEGAAEPSRGISLETLRESEERLRLALDAGRMGAWEWDIETDEVRWNAIAYELFGIDSSQTPVTRELFYSLVHPADLSRTLELIEAAKRGGTLQDEFRICRPDGEIRWLACRGGVLRNSQGQAVKLIGINFDITERKYAEKWSEQLNRDLAARVHELQTLLQVLPAGIAIASDVECRSIQGNSALNVLLGLAADAQPFACEPAETGPHFHREGQRVPLSELPLQRAARDGAVTSGLELTLLAGDGREASVLAYAAPLRDEYGQVRGAISTFLDITERKRTEQALRQSEAKYRGLIENIPAITYIAHPEDPIYATVYFSPQSQSILGIPAEDYVREPDLWVKHLHPADRERVLAAAYHMIATHEPFLDEYRMIGRDGRIVWLRDEGRWIRDEEGRIICLQGVMLDITERKRAEETLRESEQRLRLVTEVIPQLVWTGRPDGCIDFCNERWLRYTGLTEAQIQGDGWAVVLHPEDRPRILAAWQQSAQQGTPLEVEERLRGTDGRYRWFLARAMPLRDQTGQIVRWFGTCTDIQDRKESEEALRRGEARWQAILRATQDGIWEIDLCSQRVSWAPRLLEMLGYAADELTLTVAGIRMLIHPADIAETQAKLSQHLRGETPFFAHELRLLHHDGSYRWMLTRGVCLRDNAAAPTCLLGTHTDITEHKRTEEALKEADRRKDEFLAMLAHELRNPLAPIRNAVQILRMLGPANASMQKVQDMIERQVTHMTRLVDDLLDVSRITRGKILLRKERLDFVALVRAAAEDHCRMIECSNLALALKLPEEPLSMYGDPTRLAQVVGNLMQNACKFTDAGGQVTVELRREPDQDQARLVVRDTGIGMEAEILQRLFEPFSQADRSLARSRGGIGLGLALVKGLVELHGGRVAASSRGRGLGSEFTILLPLTQEQEAPIPPEVKAEPSGHGGRILIIEDNQDVSESLRMLLESWGYQVTQAYTGVAGVEAFQRCCPAVVLCDIGLPGGMDGYGVAHALRQLPGLSAYLVAVSGYGQEEDLRRALQAGFDRHMTKPIDPASLRRFLSTLSLPRPADSQEQLTKP